MEYIKDTKIEFLDMKTITEMKNSVDGIRHRRVEEDSLKSISWTKLINCVFAQNIEYGCLCLYSK